MNNGKPFIAAVLLTRPRYLKPSLKKMKFPVSWSTKKDSSYLFGEVELYVKQEDVLNAKQIINRFEADE